MCPNTERYHAADPDSTEFEVLELVAAFVRALQPETVIETGSAFGYGSQAIGNALKANGHGKLYSLEIMYPRIAEAKERCEGLPVEFINMSSLEWTPPTKDVGFAFFDSLTHLRGDEFMRYLPFMTPGAIVAFHDTGPQHLVWGKVWELQGRQLLRAINLRTPRGVAFCQVLND